MNLKNDKPTHYTGVLQCFCKSEWARGVRISERYLPKGFAEDETSRICEVYFIDDYI
jgi:hypothetical protein